MRDKEPAGYVLGSGLDEEHANFFTLLKEVIVRKGPLYGCFLTRLKELLPAEAPRMATCAGDPLGVLDLIALGVSHVCSDFPTRCASNGHALTFAIDGTVCAEDAGWR